MKFFKRHSGFAKMVAVVIMILFVGTACTTSGGFSDMTDTTKGGILGGAGGAALGALIYGSNPLAGALIGLGAGAITGGIVGHFMDDRKKDLTKALAPQINAGEVTLQVLKGNVIMVTETGESAFAPGVFGGQAGLPGNPSDHRQCAQDLWKNDRRCHRPSRQNRDQSGAADARPAARRSGPDHVPGDGGFPRPGTGGRQCRRQSTGRQG